MSRLCFDGSVPAVELRGVRKAFDGKVVLRGVDLSIQAGQTFTILGGSGTGKSVCLKHMIGLLRPDAGEVRIGGVEIGALEERELVDVRRHFGMLFQTGALFDSLTVFENVAYPLREHRRDASNAEVSKRVSSCLESVGLPDIEALLPAELSGGMRKRVALARAIALEPDVILYDEPTTGLDPANTKRIASLIRSLQERLGATSVVVTHNLELGFDVSDRLALMREGRVVMEADVESLRTSEHPELEAFLTGARPPEPADRVLPDDRSGAGAREQARRASEEDHGI